MSILHGECSSVKILCNSTDAIASKYLLWFGVRWTRKLIWRTPDSFFQHCFQHAWSCVAIQCNYLVFIDNVLLRQNLLNEAMSDSYSWIFVDGAIVLSVEGGGGRDSGLLRPLRVSGSRLESVVVWSCDSESGVSAVSLYTLSHKLKSI